MTEAEFEDLRVLVVEDNPLQQMLITRMLGNVGAHVEVARDGAHALDTLVERNYDFGLIIADINMPNMSGTEFTQKLYKGLGRTGIPVIGMTANREIADYNAAIGAGMVDLLFKPLSLEALIEVLDRIRKSA